MRATALSDQRFEGFWENRGETSIEEGKEFLESHAMI